MTINNSNSDNAVLVSENQEELLSLQNKLETAEQRMLSGEPNITLAEARAKLQEKYNSKSSQ